MTEQPKVVIAKGSTKLLNEWRSLRQRLWPHAVLDHHESEIIALLRTPDRSAGYLALVNGTVCGLAEATLRFDYVNGCESSPVLFLEGIYVEPAWRRSGVARQLCHAIEAWGIACGCQELASDTSLANIEAQLLHEALGFEETERVVFYRKPI